MSYSNNIIEQLENLEVNKDVPLSILEEAKKAKALLKATAQMRHKIACIEWNNKNKERRRQYYEEHIKGADILKHRLRIHYYRSRYGMTEEEYKAQKAELKKKKEEFNNNVKEELKTSSFFKQS